MQDVWNALKEGKEVPLSWSEIDTLQEFVNTLSEKEVDLCFHHFASRYDPAHAYGILSRCYVCWLKNINKEDRNEYNHLPSINY